MAEGGGPRIRTEPANTNREGAKNMNPTPGNPVCLHFLGAASVHNRCFGERLFEKSRGSVAGLLISRDERTCVVFQFRKSFFLEKVMRKREGCDEVCVFWVNSMILTCAKMPRRIVFLLYQCEFVVISKMWRAQSKRVYF